MGARTPPPARPPLLTSPGLGLDACSRQEVIGGPGAFLAEGYPSFEAAVRRKIIREIAAAPTPGPLVERVAV
ncbi:DUF1194 domain-containing protein [Siccirubricoccus soli]|uniref:DUF1194 domain-containing protein n=1 Tax=Siccirubricoccus soli TaxID=2899147 RepID=UPI0035137237